AAEMTFPRGAGYYFNLTKLLTFVLVYLCWVSTCWWVDRDSEHIRLRHTNWNMLLFGSGLVTILVAWALRWCWVSFILLVGFFVTPSFAYVSYRNSRVLKVQR